MELLFTIEGVIWGAMLFGLIYYTVKRIRVMGKEGFEERDN